jgi:hypothetical protein
VLYIIMDLTQFEWIKTELKRERYGLLKIQGPRRRDQELPGSLLWKGRGIYIIMYKTRGFTCKNVGKGLCAGGGVSAGGYEQDSLVTV